MEVLNKVEQTLTVPVVLLIDESGSMLPQCNNVREMLQSVKQTADDLTAEGKNVTITVVSFNNSFTIRCSEIPSSEFDPDTVEYNPRGPTALYDSLSAVFDKFDGRKTLYFVVTDGADNVSETTKEVITKRIEDAKSIGSQVEAMLMGQDAWGSQEAYNATGMGTRNFHADAQGYLDAQVYTSSVTRSFAGGN